MTRIFFWLILTPLAVVLVIFTVVNRGDVTLNLWPMPVVIDVPLFSLGLASGFAGFLVGVVITWLSGGRRRRLNRQLVRQLEAAKREEADLRKRIEQMQQSQPTPSTALLSNPADSRADAA